MVNLHNTLHFSLQRKVKRRRLLKDQWCARRRNRVPLLSHISSSLDLVDQGTLTDVTRDIIDLERWILARDTPRRPFLHPSAPLPSPKNPGRSSPLLLAAVASQQTRAKRAYETASNRHVYRAQFRTRFLHACVASSFFFSFFVPLSSFFSPSFSLLQSFLSPGNSPGRKEVRWRGFDDSVKLTAQIRRARKRVFVCGISSFISVSFFLYFFVSYSVVYI